MIDSQIPESPAGPTQSPLVHTQRVDLAMRKRTHVPGILASALVPRTLTMIVLGASGLGLLSVPIGEYDDSVLLVGARLVASGKTPYIDFYTHYGPFGYTVLSALLQIFGHPGLALRIGQIALLAGIAILIHLLFRLLQPQNRFREYAVPLLVLANSQVAMEPAFFGFAFATVGLVLFLLARIAVRAFPATLLTIAAGAALAAAALTRPGFAAYSGGALLLLEASAGRPRFGTLRSPFFTLALLFGAAAFTALLMGVVLYPKIPPVLGFNATVIVPARLMSSGARYLPPAFLPDTGTAAGGIATGAALAAMTVAWTFAVPRLKVWRFTAVCIAAGGLLPFLLMLSGHSGRDASLLALTLFVLAGLVAIAGRVELKESALLRASATFGIAAAAFGHYFWMRADNPHLLPFLTLALVGAALLLASLRALGGVVLLGVLLFAYASALRPLFFPAAKLLEPDIAASLRPWRCTVFSLYERNAVAFADRQADPGSRFVAVGSSQAWSSGNPIVLFLISSRLPYTRWFHYDPGVQNSPAVQKEMERALEASGSRTAVVWKAGRYLWSVENPKGKLRSPFDDYFDRLYPITAARFGPYDVRVRAAGSSAAR